MCLQCCCIECDNKAEFEIKNGNTFDDYTHSCVKHVGELLGDGINMVYVVED